MGDVIDFPGKKELDGMKMSQKVAKSVESGKKVTQQQALGAMMENKSLVDGMMNTVQRVVQSQIQVEKALGDFDTHLAVLLKSLQDNGILTEEQLKASWDKYVVQPQEEALTKHIELLKTQSAEDAYFAEVISKVRTHAFNPRQLKDRTVEPDEVRRFYMQMLLDPASRKAVIPELSLEITDLPKYSEPESLPSTDQEHKMPDCRYCGKPDCPVCNQLTAEVVEMPVDALPLECEQLVKPEECANTSDPTVPEVV